MEMVMVMVMGVDGEVFVSRHDEEWIAQCGYGPRGKYAETA